jgi:hypothetical protein
LTIKELRQGKRSRKKKTTEAAPASVAAIRTCTNCRLKTAVRINYGLLLDAMADGCDECPMKKAISKTLYISIMAVGDDSEKEPTSMPYHEKGKCQISSNDGNVTEDLCKIFTRKIFIFYHHSCLTAFNS